MNQYTSGSAAYRRDDVLTASPLRLVVLAMSGTMTRLERARRAAERGDANVYRSELGRARALIAELLGSLDHAAGGTIAVQLGSLYEFMLSRLLVPGSKPNAAAVASAHELMKKIKDGFDAILAAGAEQQPSNV